MVEEVHHVLNEDVIVINTSGRVIASSDESRIHTFHEGSLLVLVADETKMLTTQEAKQLKGVKAGVNVPLHLHDETIGVLGQGNLILLHLTHSLYKK